MCKVFIFFLMKERYLFSKYVSFIVFYSKLEIFLSGKWEKYFFNKCFDKDSFIKLKLVCENVVVKVEGLVVGFDRLLKVVKMVSVFLVFNVCRYCIFFVCVWFYSFYRILRGWYCFFFRLLMRILVVILRLYIVE